MFESVVNEIIQRVYDNNIPTEDGEFTIDGKVYSTVEVEGKWRCCYFGSNYNTYKRDVVCEVFCGGESLNKYIYQYQEKTEYIKNVPTEYRYGECIEVKRQKEETVIEGWVKA